MESVLFIILIINVIVSLTTIYLVNKKFQVHELVPVLEPTECKCASELIEELKRALIPIVLEEPVKVPTPPDDSHKAWKNRVEEPSVAPHSPHGPPPIPGPLERPYGFSR